MYIDCRKFNVEFNKLIKLFRSRAPFPRKHMVIKQKKYLALYLFFLCSI